MPRLPRRDLIEEPEVGIYHSVQRVVRRAFLCGASLRLSHQPPWLFTALTAVRNVAIKAHFNSETPIQLAWLCEWIAIATSCR